MNCEELLKLIDNTMTLILAQVDEEKLGDIVSLIDSIQEDYLPPIPTKYKKVEPELFEERIVNLDSPSMSATQVGPPWPKPRDKTHEVPEPDPDPEPTPPPTPPPKLEPEGEEEEIEEDNLAEQEEAARKATELPDLLPPPPPSPQSEPEVPVAQPTNQPTGDEVQMKLEPVNVERQVLQTEDAANVERQVLQTKDAANVERQVLQTEDAANVERQVLQTEDAANVERQVLQTEDAAYRTNLRKLRKKITSPLTEYQLELTAEEELANPSNFKKLLDNSEIIRATVAIFEPKMTDILPFVAIMAIVTSYKYVVNTWTVSLVNFVVETGKKLYEKKEARFQFAPVHIIPRVAIGHQTYHVHVDVIEEGPTWELEDIMSQKFFTKYDRGMLTTATYSCAFFKRNGLYYLYDGTPCNAMGLREEASKKSKACFMRFTTLHGLVVRIAYNKNGKTEDQHFVLSRIIVRSLLIEPRLKLPEDYDYATSRSKSKKSKFSIDVSAPDKKMSSIDKTYPTSQTVIGYQQIPDNRKNETYVIEGTMALIGRKTSWNEQEPSSDIKACHFICLIAMLMATMHPIRTWSREMVDICMEKGLEIFEKATNLEPCETRVIKNIILDDKIINVNIQKIIVINENLEKHLEQYLRGVLNRLRYVMVTFREYTLVICYADGYYHLFDPYPSTGESGDVHLSYDKDDDDKDDDDKDDDDKDDKDDDDKDDKDDDDKDDKDDKDDDDKDDDDKNICEEDLSESKYKISLSKTKLAAGKQAGEFAGWTLYRRIDYIVRRLKNNVPSPDSPEFYTFELTSAKLTSEHAALNYRLSPLFKPDENPNVIFLKPNEIQPIVDERMYWLNIDGVPWSRTKLTNDLGVPRGILKSMWKDWDIEFSGDLCSLWGTIHPLDSKFAESNRGKQYLAVSVVALVMITSCSFSAWTSSLLDGIVEMGDVYHTKCAGKFGRNHEISVTDLEKKFDDMYPYSFSVKFDKVIFGFMYNIYPDRFNLSKALVYFFERNNLGILTSPAKNLAFGKSETSYFMYDCQSYGSPVFSPGQGASYILKCESLNRLIYCITLTLNVRRHGQQFHLFGVTVTLNEKSKQMF